MAGAAVRARTAADQGAANFEGADGGHRNSHDLHYLVGTRMPS